MKCYFCVVEPNSDNDVYLDLLYVCLKSARQNTNLDLYVLYDGSDVGHCYSILKEFDVHIIKHKFSHYDYLEKTYPQEYIRQICSRNISYDVISATFMRFDIPFIEEDDDYILYSDYDVMFLKDFSTDKFGDVSYLAASAEFDKNLDDITYFNSGVLYLNVKSMREVSNQVFDMLENGIKNTTGLLDQGYLNQVCFDKMTKMPLEFNWKPYWGYNKDDYIIHFHGMKPGGNAVNSGYNMSDALLYNLLANHWSDIDGYVYYIMQYYEFLGKDGKEWLSDFIALNFTSIIEHILSDVNVKDKSVTKYNLYRLHLGKYLSKSSYYRSEADRYLNKYKKYKKRNYILWGIIVFLALLLVSVIFYIGYKL